MSLFPLMTQPARDTEAERRQRVQAIPFAMPEATMSDIGVFYTCRACGVHQAEVKVRARRPDEDIMPWMESLTIALTLDHRRRSPLCAAESMDEVRVPLPSAQDARIGDPQKH